MRNILFKIKRYLLKMNSDYVDERSLILSGKILAHQNSKFIRVKNLSELEFSVFSQWGEDGIIDWLIGKIPNIHNTFIEFGVEDYTESNTRFLLKNRNWSGLVIDGSYQNIDKIKNQDIYWRHSLVAKHAFIDCENINELMSEFSGKNEIGLLSIDIDGNDYWVWEAIDSISPYIVICEYNAVLGDLHSLTVPYRPDFNRTSAHYSNLYFGASIKALTYLGEKKGYTYLGTTSSGVNAFFIRNDLAHFVTESIDEVASYPSKFREARDSKGDLNFTQGEDRVGIIRKLPLFDVLNKACTTLEDYSEYNSSEWNNNIFSR
jgi:hypothetical protein